MSAAALSPAPQLSTSHKPVVAAIRRLIIGMGITLLVTRLFMISSKGGGVDSELYSQIRMTLQPSMLPVAAAFLVLFWALNRVMGADYDEARAVVFLARVRTWFIVVMVIGVVYSQVLFLVTPLEGWGPNGGTWIYPFPFGQFDIDTVPVVP